MATIKVKSMREMIRLNAKHNKRSKRASRNILKRLAVLDHRMAVSIAGTRKFSGTLVSQINLNQINRLTIRVIASAPHAFEIEEGLKRPEFRRFSDYPKLRAWAEARLKIDPGRTGVLVGGPNSRIHPDGLHFMLQGAQFAYKSSPAVVSQELRKIDLRGG